MQAEGTTFTILNKFVNITGAVNTNDIMFADSYHPTAHQLLGKLLSS